ncbi:hypothetical protein NIES2100_17730 [Calothrix sp. NIES-2100]|uniref:hypothetical protein n=1 Tax=Calothrix sp. NIES-2100 TaxID=1954172 RepID=UPI000B610AD9|nr:hypothetical protein NIES2100_17730 [Calothrix sp. NIES-2100]
MQIGAPWKSAQEKGDRIVAQVNDDTFEFDFAIAGTGYFVDLILRQLTRRVGELPQELRVDAKRLVVPYGKQATRSVS